MQQGALYLQGFLSHGVPGMVVGLAQCCAIVFIPDLPAPSLEVPLGVNLDNLCSPLSPSPALPAPGRMLLDTPGLCSPLSPAVLA